MFMSLAVVNTIEVSYNCAVNVNVTRHKICHYQYYMYMHAFYILHIDLCQHFSVNILYNKAARVYNKEGRVSNWPIVADATVP